MIWWQFGLWGGFGGLAVEALEFYGAIRRTGNWPWKISGEAPPALLAVSVLIRIGLGVGLAIAAAQANQISGSFAAIGIGVASPLVLEQMQRQLPSRGTDVA